MVKDLLDTLHLSPQLSCDYKTLLCNEHLILRFYEHLIIRCCVTNISFYACCFSIFI